MANERGSQDPFHIIWNFFASVKLTVGLLLALAATSIIGTLIPQNETPAAYVRAFGEVLYRIFYILDIFDMYHSWWFQFLLLMLAANITVCSIERLSATWKIVFVKKPNVNISRMTRLPDKAHFCINMQPAQVEKTYLPYISKKYRYTRIEKTVEGYGIYGENGRWTRLGVYGVHLSVLLLLIGGLVGSIFGFEGFVNIPEGETMDRIRLRNTPQTKRLDFGIRCDDFDVQFYDTGAPKEFRSRLTILENGQPVLNKDIIVNDPLRYKGINIFQSSYGPVSAKGATLNFKSSATGMVYSQPATMGEPVAVPEAGGEFIIEEYRNSYQFRGRNIGEVFVGSLTPGNGNPETVVLPLRFPDFDRMRNGDWVVFVSDPRYRYFTGLQVTKDPSVWIVYTGFIMMIIGCYVAFFMSHERIFVEVMQQGRQSSIHVSGTSNKNKLGMRKKVKTIADRLEGLSQ
jgi:cytochrome c biogenesis protein